MQRHSNRHGAAVLRVEGARGIVFKIKFRDAHGVQVKETLGRETDGWSEQKARAELARVDTAFHQLAADEDSDDRRNPDLHGSPSPRGSRADEDSDDRRNRIWVEQARVVFRVVAALGLRRGEVLGLRWRNVLLADPAGPRIRVAETIVHGHPDTPKSAASERTLAIGPKIAAELFDHRARTAYKGDEDLVFCHPEKWTPLDHKRYAVTLRLALAKAKITHPVRPFHDFRHSAITNAAIAGNSPAAIQARAGHADFSTTQRYINLAGVIFKDEAEQAEARILGTDLGTESAEVPKPVGSEGAD